MAQETLARLCNDSHWIRLVAVNHIYKLSVRPQSALTVPA